MTPEQTYTALVLTIKGVGILFAAFILIFAILYALGHTPDFPDDDGERM